MRVTVGYVVWVKCVVSITVRYVGSEMMCGECQGVSVVQ